MFKKVTGINFTDYLSRVRIEKSKNLLLNPEPAGQRDRFRGRLPVADSFQPSLQENSRPGTDRLPRPIAGKPLTPSRCEVAPGQGGAPVGSHSGRRAARSAIQLALAFGSLPVKLGSMEMPSSCARHLMPRQLVCAAIGLAAGFVAVIGSNAAEPPPSAGPAPMNWISLPDPRVEIRGLPWLNENLPDLWRLPKSAQTNVPKAVWNRAAVPDGGRIRLTCNSACLGIRVQAAHEQKKPGYFDAYIDGQYAGSVSAAGTQRVDLVFFEQKGRARKDITLYLPNNQQVQVFAVGVDSDAELSLPPAFALKRPIVCYGSSVLQGSGAAHPSKTYPAAVARRLNLDFVNLGFGGAGKAEAEVVALVNQLDASGYLFDLGKSYGAPTPERYSRMLDAIRGSHPDTPIFCVTPIYSTKEEKEPAYKKRSEDLRLMMRQAATSHCQAGDKLIFVVEGLDLFGAADRDAFADPAHPNDEGNERMAQRLAPMMEKVIFGKGQRGLGHANSHTNGVPARLP